jgi:UDP-N-acetylmuramate dehydrogenase
MALLENVPLAPHTTLRIGGPARYFCHVTTRAELDDALAFARRHGLRPFILGGGSNILAPDEGLAAVVIKMELRGVSVAPDGDDLLVTPAAGEPWDDLVALTVERGAWGLENLSSIPGTVGAAPVQNIGAYGAEVRDTIERVRVVDSITGVERELTNAACRFAYRDSVFKRPGNPDVIVAVTFRLAARPRPNLTYKDLRQHFDPGARPTQAEIRDAVMSIRRNKFPDLARVGTAGSFWKNPIITEAEFLRLSAMYPGLPSFPAGPGRVKVSLAWILDEVCGLKGYSRGHVALFERQPLILVTQPGATAADVRTFEAHIRSAVKAKTGLDLEPEVGLLTTA